MERPERQRLLLMGDALVLFLLLSGGLNAYLSVYLAPFGLLEGTWSLVVGYALFSALSAVLWSGRRGGWIAAGLLCAGGLALWGLWDRLGPAFRLMRAAATLVLSERGAGVEVLRLPAEEWAAGMELLSPALLALSLLLALVLGWIVVWARAWYLAALASAVPVLPAILAGLLPDWTALTACAAGWGTMLLSALYDHRDKERLGRGVLMNLAGMCTLLAILTAALPRDGYMRPQWATDARDRLLSAVTEGTGSWLEMELGLGELGLDLELPGMGGVSELDDGAEDLTQAGPRQYSGQTVLTVKTDQPDPAGRIYLRGGSAARYTGHSWETVDPALYAKWMYAGREALFPSVSAPEESLSRMTIRYRRAGAGTSFYPYFPARELETDANGLAARSGQSCAVDYVPLEDGIRLDAPKEESGYRAFVRRQYLDVPDQAWEVLAPVLSRQLELSSDNINGELPESLEQLNAAQRTAAYLAQSASYDPNTPAMEPGEDFVTHFLETGRGYCVHFATAGVLLLRMQGIPARYVTGYTALLNHSGRATVADSAAHAWAEIYIDGFGWYPVEMTPGYLAPDGGLNEHPAPLTSGEAVPSEPEETPPPADEEDGAVDPEDRNQPGLPEDEEDRAGETPGAEGKAAPVPLELTWLKYLLLAAAAAAVPVAVYSSATFLRRRSRSMEDTNRSVIDAYVRCQRVLRWGIGEADSRLEELAQKAKFSQHQLTEEERTAAWVWLEEARVRVEAALPVWKYWLMRAMRPLL